jgi:conjugative transfer signal peptidase TraF
MNISSRKSFLGLIGVALVVAVYQAFFMNWSIVYNATPSIPTGWYYLKHDKQFSHGDLVVFNIPKDAKSLLLERGWITEKVIYLIKPVAAMEGDDVCIHEQKISMAGVDYGAVKTHAKDGSALPQIKLCGKVSKGNFTVGIKGDSGSFDSRYMGEIPIEMVEGIATPLWLN